MIPRASAYERDFYAWALSQVSALRERRFDDLDLENLSEEVEDLARKLRLEIRTRLRTVLSHLLKWRFWSARRSTKWQLTLLEHRDQLGQVFEVCPSLRPQAAELIQSAYASAVKLAAIQMKLDQSQRERTFPAQCPWIIEQILDEDYLPNGARPRG